MIARFHGSQYFKSHVIGPATLTDRGVALRRVTGSMLVNVGMQVNTYCVCVWVWVWVCVFERERGNKG